MKYPGLVLGLVAALAVPAFAQPGPPPGPGNGPPPEMQQQLDQARSGARTQAMTALSSDHQTAVNAVIARVKAGQLTDVHDAAKQIDAVLTAKESQAVLAARDKMMDDLRVAMATCGNGAPGPGNGGGSGPPLAGGFGNAPGGGAGIGGRPGGGRPHGGQAMRNDAGFALLTLNLDREQMRSLFADMRPTPDHP